MSSLPYTPPIHKIKVGLLGCTGVVGQQFIRLLHNHPWFELSVLGASERSAGQKYTDACTWKLPSDIPQSIIHKPVVTCEPNNFTVCSAVFSALDSSVAGDIELSFAQSGYSVFSNARNWRYDNTIPILVPYANSSHIHSITEQQNRFQFKQKSGYIITNANCSSTGLVVALKPLLDKYGIQSVHVVTMQALSGAGMLTYYTLLYICVSEYILTYYHLLYLRIGYPGVSSLDIMDNIYPYISGEEEKMEMEPQKILGKLDTTQHNTFVSAEFNVSAMCNRVPVIDGHTECVSIKLNKSYNSIDDIIQCLQSYTSECQLLQLPSAATTPLYVHTNNIRPQPRLDRDHSNGMCVTVGRIRKCNLYDIKFNLVSHNTVIGAAGGSILNAELAYAKGYIIQK